MVRLQASHRRALYASNLSAFIMFNYNAKACEGSSCLETSPDENSTVFSHSPHATLLPGAEPILTHSLLEAIKSLGGIQVSALVMDFKN